MLSRMLGGILLIVGTTIGGGMLALPVVLAQSGLLGSVLVLFFGWMIMTFSAFLILEGNLWFPPSSNLIMMAKKTLGPLGAITAWVCYLLLFYLLLAAYIAGGSDVFHDLIRAAGLQTSTRLDAILFTLCLGGIVYLGIRSIDHVNRLLMFLKLGAFLVLVLLMIPALKATRFDMLNSKYVISAVTVVITSFGFANIIPSLRVYLHNDIRAIRRVILIGSLIPLVSYIVWVTVILGGIPFAGPFGMHSIIVSDHSTFALTQALIHHANSVSVTGLTRLFTSVCMLTSFLGVALCLVDFLADGLSFEKVGLQKVFLHVLTLVPPLLIALTYPYVFVKGLDYAGIIIAILLLILPALIVWRGRYYLKFTNHYQVWGGKSFLILLMLAAGFVILQGLW